MKVLAETEALKRLREFKKQFQETVREEYEPRAKPCSACDTPGACCLDQHFVNVRITRLEAKAIVGFLDTLPESNRDGIERRIDKTIDAFHLDDENAGYYACPLYEPGTGCLVHDAGKPLPCIHHACYEKKEDLPPEEMLLDGERSIENLNRQTYGRQQTFLPLPVAIRKASI